MTYGDNEVLAATAEFDKYTRGVEGEIGAALSVVGLSAARTAREARIRDDMIRVAHRAGRRFASWLRSPGLAGRR